MSRMVHTGLAPYDPADEVDKLEERKQKESGPVKTSLDLNEFLVFNGKDAFQGRRGKWLTVDKMGGVVVTHEIGKTLPVEAMVELRLNRRGNILVMKEAPGGLPAKPIYPKRGMARRIPCAALKKTLLELGVTLPARFVAEWDEELKAWVGRR